MILLAHLNGNYKSLVEKRAARAHISFASASFWKRGAGAHINGSARSFGIRRRKVVVIGDKKPREQKEVFIHLSCPVPSIMSRDWPLSIQPAEQVSRPCDGRRCILFSKTLNFHIASSSMFFGRSRGRERTYIGGNVHFRKKKASAHMTIVAFMF